MTATRKLDYRKIKASVSMLEALSRYNVRLRHVGQDSWRGRCPLPTHKEGDKNESFAVKEGKEGWGWSCQSDSCIAARGENKKGGNVVDFVRFMENLPTFYDAAARLNEMYSLNAWLDGEGALSKPLTKPESASNDAANSLAAPLRKPLNETGCKENKPLGFALKDVNPEHPMIQERGITVETARTFGVGFFPGKGSMAGRIVFPLYQWLSDAAEKAALVGYCGRTTLEVTKENPKWLFPAGLLKHFLYGLERCDPAKPLVLVESPWAVLFLFQHGVQAAALMGSELTAEQERALSPFHVIQLALDDDDAGHQKAEPIAARLRQHHKVIKAFFKE